MRGSILVVDDEAGVTLSLESLATPSGTGKLLSGCGQTEP